MDAFDGTPRHILGYKIRSRTRIYVSWLIPAAFELLVYIIQIVADSAVSYQHFRSHQSDFGWITLSLILLPPVLSFTFILSSREQWANPKHANRFHFVGYQLINLLFFPFCVIYRFSRRLFWSIEALFHDDDDSERMLCLAKASECSTCELYHIIQAYGQSAPQIILQLYHMLTQDLFRNYHTTTVQAISLIFSAIDLAVITTMYQRFESQKLVGRPYPWSSPTQIASQKQRLLAVERIQNQCEHKNVQTKRFIANFPETDKIMENFKLQTKGISDKIETTPYVQINQSHIVKLNGTDDIYVDESPKTTRALVHNYNPDNSFMDKFNKYYNSTDDEKIQTNNPKLMLHANNANTFEYADTIPDSPPPPLPAMSTPSIEQNLLRLNDSDRTGSGNHLQQISVMAMNRLSTFKDMFIVNAQLYIKDNVPRPPKILLGGTEDSNIDGENYNQRRLTYPPSTTIGNDTVDFFIPLNSRTIINGTEQDDFAGKCVAFLGWMAFICMRMLSLATFCVFLPQVFLIVIFVHYQAMLFCLVLESKFQAKLNRTLFYILLAYVYIFVVLEFRIKFHRVKLWYVGYFLVTMTENITMTMIWYMRDDFESWWFEVICNGIIYSGVLCVITLLVYYCILKPKQVVLIMEDDTADHQKK